jgi:hypothetical protein
MFNTQPPPAAPAAHPSMCTTEPPPMPDGLDALTRRIQNLTESLRESLNRARAELAKPDVLLGKPGRKVEPSEDLQDGEREDDAARHARAYGHAAA